VPCIGFVLALLIVGGLHAINDAQVVNREEELCHL
jgi:hypothetical protein